MVNVKFNKIHEINALIVGDFMLDSYIVGSVNRISPEAPVPVLHKHSTTYRLGGAGNVVLNIVKLGANAKTIGRVGQDENGNFLIKELNNLKVDTTFMFKEGKTTVKTRIGTKNQQIARIDDEEILSTSLKQIEFLKKNIVSVFDGVNLIILSDYNKGFLSKEVCSTIIKEANKRNIPIFVDPKGNSIEKYKGCTAITPNFKEFCELFNVPNSNDITEDEIKHYASVQCKKFNIKYAIITRSERGISTYDTSKNIKTDFKIVPKAVVDVTGAGDTVVAVFSVLFACGFKISDCAKLSNYAASIVISKYGAVPITFNELVKNTNDKLLIDNNEILEKFNSIRNIGKKIVFTNGCFDILHAGHVKSFHDAKKLGDVLVVGVNSDDSIRRIKGNKRPIISLNDRITLLSELNSIDFVIPFDDDAPLKLIELIKPNVLVKGGDWKNKKVIGSEFVIKNGGKVVFIDLKKGLSTTSIINKIKQL